MHSGEDAILEGALEVAVAVLWVVAAVEMAVAMMVVGELADDSVAKAAEVAMMVEVMRAAN